MLKDDEQSKRLEEAARSAEILIGGQTEQLVRGIALLEPADPIVAKGRIPRLVVRQRALMRGLYSADLFWFPGR